MSEEVLAKVRLQAQAEADAAAALAAGPRALDAARLRRELTREMTSLRVRVAGHALRQWSRCRTAVCLRAWREYVWRAKAGRAAAMAADAARMNAAAASSPASRTGGAAATTAARCGRARMPAELTRGEGRTPPYGAATAAAAAGSTLRYAVRARPTPQRRHGGSTPRRYAVRARHPSCRT